MARYKQKQPGLASGHHYCRIPLLTNPVRILEDYTVLYDHLTFHPRLARWRVFRLSGEKAGERGQLFTLSGFRGR